LYRRILKAAEKIAQHSRYGAGQYLVCSTDVAELLVPKEVEIWI
jgi:hypothetical protein